MKVAVFLITERPEWNPPDHFYDKLALKFPNIDFLFPKDVTQLFNSLSDAEVFFSQVIVPEILAKAPNLKWFHSSGIQYGHLFPREAFDRILITNSKGIYAEPVSRILMETILSLVGESKSVAGLNLGIVGLGHNGTMLAEQANSHGMNIVATKRNVGEKPKCVDNLWPPDEIEKLLSISDVIALTVPLTKETEGMFNEDAFSKMKKGVILVSSSRPQVINEQALVAAMKDGTVAGLGIDDMWPKESPVLELPNVVVLPHITPEEPGTWERMFDLFAENLQFYIENRPLKNIMDKDLLY